MTTPPFRPWGGPAVHSPMTYLQILDELDTGQVFLDTMAVSRFTLVGRLDLLRTAFAGRMHVAKAVETELDRAIDGRAQLTALKPVFAPPPWYKAEAVSRPEEVQWSLDIRTQWAANKGQLARPLDNLGETDTLVLCHRTHWVFITNDHRARRYDGYHGITVGSMPFLFVKLVRDNRIDKFEMWDLYERMVKQHGLWVSDGLEPDREGKRKLFYWIRLGVERVQV
jgi:predicted nucleic acid-binding protein